MMHGIIKKHSLDLAHDLKYKAPCEDQTYNLVVIDLRN